MVRNRYKVQTLKHTIMKSFNKTSLPELVVYNGETFTLNTTISAGMALSGTSLDSVQRAVKSTGKKCICVNVMSKNLKGKTDLHGKPYKPTQHIFTN